MTKNENMMMIPNPRQNAHIRSHPIVSTSILLFLISISCSCDCYCYGYTLPRNPSLVRLHNQSPHPPNLQQFAVSRAYTGSSTTHLHLVTANKDATPISGRSTSSPQLKSARKRRFKSFILPLFFLLTLLLARPRAAWASSAAAAVTQQDPASIAAAATSTSSHLATTIVATQAVSGSLENQLSLRLAYAAFIGAALGKERSMAKHSAGVRTMALVAMGAAAYTVCSAYGFIQFPGRYDPSRMAANVASGVGFIGAGVITTSGNNSGATRAASVVHGLTTAATIWLSAAVGVACGVGLFRVATTAALITVSILRLGRMKPKAKPKVAVHTSVETESGLRRGQVGIISNSTDSEDDLEEEDSAELHDTSDWDEQVNHEDDDDEEEEDEFDSLSISRSNSTTVLQSQESFSPSEELPFTKVIEEAWGNERSGSDLFTDASTIDFEALESLRRRERSSSQGKEP